MKKTLFHYSEKRLALAFEAVELLLCHFPLIFHHFPQAVVRRPLTNCICPLVPPPLTRSTRLWHRTIRTISSLRQPPLFPRLHRPPPHTTHRKALPNFVALLINCLIRRRPLPPAPLLTPSADGTFYHQHKTPAAHHYYSVQEMKINL
ncbi:hypothetical protein niasHT_019330 [Heterodera trifolii]|uniref:Uncharacterized protein n=1 Tax=Heterodera trifolii TaxID=157864 RepID=A0ABD2L7Q2_9BILA